MSRRALILVNPKAGREKSRKLVQNLSLFLTSNEIEFKVEETNPSNQYHNIDDCNEAIIVGGDGTINYAVNALPENLPVAIVPAGSGNDFVKSLSIGKTRKQQFETILNGKLTNVDLGIANNRKFANGIGIGFDGQIVKEMLKRKVPLLSGQAKYYFHVLHILSSYKSRKFHLAVDEETFNENLILLTISNGTTFGGGFKLCPHARLDDGHLAICKIGSLSPLRRYLNIVRLQNGSHTILPEVEISHARSVNIFENNMLNAHIDGEDFGSPPFNVSILPGVLKIRQTII